MPANLQHVNRRLTARERARHARVRASIAREFPPKPATDNSRSGIAERIRMERESRQLTWYALAKLAGIPNQATVRAIEQGKDVRLSNVERVARALGLSLKLVG
jgi:DNA-binding XRE family transcriptional regulator